MKNLPTQMLLIDCQNDFISGSLACTHATEAIKAIIKFLNQHPELNVYYSCDNHSNNHCSFIANGGQWPPHCVVGEKGSQLDPLFYEALIYPQHQPHEANIFYKGCQDQLEEYSAFNAANKTGKSLKQIMGEKFLIAGIASEFCVKESILDFQKAGHTPTLYLPGVAYVEQEKHLATLAFLRDTGLQIISQPL